MCLMLLLSWHTAQKERLALSWLADQLLRHRTLVLITCELPVGGCSSG